MRLPSTSDAVNGGFVPLLPITMPPPLLPEIRLPVPTSGPPTVGPPMTASSPETEMPGPPLPRSAVPVPSVPMNEPVIWPPKVNEMPGPEKRLITSACATTSPVRPAVPAPADVPFSVTIGSPAYPGWVPPSIRNPRLMTGRGEAGEIVTGPEPIANPIVPMDPLANASWMAARSVQTVEPAATAHTPSPGVASGVSALLLTVSVPVATAAFRRATVANAPACETAGVSSEAKRMQSDARTVPLMNSDGKEVAAIGHR